MQTILLTGGSGYIGTHLCLRLLESGYRIVVLDSNVNSFKINLDRVKILLKISKPNAINNLHFVKDDIRKENIIDDLFSNYLKSNNPIEAVVHLAGLKSIEESSNNPLEYWETNVYGSINLLKVMHKYNCRKLLFSSSASIYRANNTILNEKSLINPLNPYSETKYAVENILKSLSKNSSAWSFIILRYFNPIGAHFSGKIGENCKGKATNIFPIINNVALGLVEKVNIFGDDWDTFDGTCIRDYIHIMDLVEGHLFALRNILNKESLFSTFNLGTGKGSSVKELIRTFEEVNKVKVPFIVSNRRKGDVASSVADVKEANKKLGWKAKFNLEDMCRDGWAWYSSGVI